MPRTKRAIADLLQESLAAEVIELAEYALDAVEGAMGSIDDSDGNMGGVLDRLQEVHYTACKLIRRSGHSPTQEGGHFQ